ncbi:MAG: winged helix-turn-helix transcriptional regulator [Phycisphaerae bacterium]|jgi:ArsR family transcriptional regulator
MKPPPASADLLFRAFADPTRLRILNLLSEGPVCVCDLCAALAERQPKVSRHLAYLKRAGLVCVRRDGKWKYYGLAPRLGGLEAALLGCLRDCLGGLEPLKTDARRLRRRRCRPACC